MIEYVLATVSLVIGITAMFGWSHKTLRKRLDQIESETAQGVTEEKIRQMIDDKLEPLRVEYRAVHMQLQEMKIVSRSLDLKIEKILDILRENAKK